MHISLKVPLECEILMFSDILGVWNIPRMFLIKSFPILGYLIFLIVEPKLSILGHRAA
jgi:hypothetical protein